VPSALPLSQSAKVSGRWKEKTSRLRGLGSRRLVKRVSVPVLWKGGRAVAGTGWYMVGRTHRVFLGLHLDAGERLALFLGFDHADGVSVDVEEVVGRVVAGLQQELADRDATRGMEVDGFGILHSPAGSGKGFIDALAGAIFRLHGTLKSAAGASKH
jgi:hypothetical protein